MLSPSAKLLRSPSRQRVRKPCLVSAAETAARLSYCNFTSQAMQSCESHLRDGMQLVVLLHRIRLFSVGSRLLIAPYNHQRDAAQDLRMAE